MPFATYTDLTTYATLTHPSTFPFLPTLQPLSQNMPRLKIGFTPCTSVYAYLWPRTSRLSFLTSHGKYIAPGTFTLAAPFRSLWDGVKREDMLGHTAVFDCFVRICLLQGGYGAGLVEVTAWPPYCFKEVLGELCEIYRRDDGGGGEGEGTVGKEGVVVVWTDGQCLCGNETVGKKGSSNLSAGIKTEVKSLKDYKEAEKKRSRMKRVAAAEKAKMTSGKQK
jgi:hypothetical protein